MSWPGKYCPNCGNEMLTGGCPNWMCPTRNWSLGTFQPDLSAEIEQLKADVERLKAWNAKLQGKHARATAHVAKLKREIFNLKVEMSNPLLVPVAKFLAKMAMAKMAETEPMKSYLLDTIEKMGAENTKLREDLRLRENSQGGEGMSV
jgi:hypothetical protein